MLAELARIVKTLEGMKPKGALPTLTPATIQLHEECRLSILWLEGLQEWYTQVENDHWRLVRETKMREAADAAKAQRQVLLEDEALWPEAYILNRPAVLGVRRGRRVPDDLKHIVPIHHEILKWNGTLGNLVVERGEQHIHSGPKTYVFSTDIYDPDATPLYAQQFPKLREFTQPEKKLTAEGMTGTDWQDYLPLPEDPNRAIYEPGDDGYEEDLDHPGFQDINYTELRGKKAQPANELIFDPENTEEDEQNLRSTWERVEFHEPDQPCPRCHRSPVVCICTPPTELDPVPDRRVQRLDALLYAIQALQQKVVVAETKLRTFESYRSNDARFEDHRLRKIAHLTQIIVESEEEASGLQWQAEQVEQELSLEGELPVEYTIIDGIVATFNPSGKYMAQTRRTRERDDADYAGSDPII